MFHRKMLIVDRLMVSVGWTNFDNRSFRLNDEANLNVYDAQFATRVSAVFEDDLKRAHRVTFEAWKAGPGRRSSSSAPRHCCRPSSEVDGDEKGKAPASRSRVIVSEATYVVRVGGIRRHGARQADSRRRSEGVRCTWRTIHSRVTRPEVS